MEDILDHLKELVGNFRKDNNVNFVDIKCKFDTLEWSIMKHLKEDNNTIYVISLGWQFKTHHFKEVGTTTTNVELYIRRFKKYLKNYLKDFEITHEYDGDCGRQFIIIIIENKN